MEPLTSLRIEEEVVWNCHKHLDEILMLAEFQDAGQLLIFLVLKSLPIAKLTDFHPNLKAINGFSNLIRTITAPSSLFLNVFPILNQIDQTFSPFKLVILKT